MKHFTRVFLLLLALLLLATSCDESGHTEDTTAPNGTSETPFSSTEDESAPLSFESLSYRFEEQYYDLSILSYLISDGNLSELLIAYEKGLVNGKVKANLHHVEPPLSYAIREQSISRENFEAANRQLSLDNQQNGTAFHTFTDEEIDLLFGTASAFRANAKHENAWMLRSDTVYAFTDLLAMDSIDLAAFTYESDLEDPQPREALETYLDDIEERFGLTTLVNSIRERIPEPLDPNGLSSALEYYPPRLNVISTEGMFADWPEIDRIVAEQTALMSSDTYRWEKLPLIYYVIRETGITKEEFLHLNETVEKHYRPLDGSPALGGYTEEQIEALFSANPDRIRRELHSPLILAIEQGLPEDNYVSDSGYLYQNCVLYNVNDLIDICPFPNAKDMAAIRDYIAALIATAKNASIDVTGLSELIQEYRNCRPVN